MATAGELASWNDTATRAAITDFVARVTGDGPDHLPPEQRVATFDNDGTLWCEKPMPIQLDFILRRFAAMAEADASLRDQQPWKAAHERDLGWLGAAMVKHYHGDDSDLALLLTAVPQAFAGLTVEAYADEVDAFFRAADHPQLDRPYMTCSYQPMLELLDYLEDHGFTTYIASGGDRDFMRPVAGDLYGVPPERVIGSSLTLDYRHDDDGSGLLYKPQMEFFDDGPTKPVRIWSRIGRRPTAAVGNSNGDVPMLHFAGGPSGPALRLLLLHDDPAREFDYTAGAEEALDQARAHRWTVISIKNDWSTVFPEHPRSPAAAADRR
jgi:phosphoserine phosphatase